MLFLSFFAETIPVGKRLNTVSILKMKYKVFCCFRSRLVFVVVHFVSIEFWMLQERRRG